jgi:hypothetical protein
MVGEIEKGFQAYSQPHVASAKEMFFGDGGKGHYPESRSETYKFQPGRRKLYPNSSEYEKHGGIMKLPIPQPRVQPRAEQRHLPGSQQRSGYDVPEHSIEAALNRKNRVVRENGSLARDYISKEVTLDVSFGVKKKMHGGISDMRNGIPVANPGDKLYAAVEYSPGFYREFNSRFSRVGGREGNGGSFNDIAPPGKAREYANARDTTVAFNRAGMTNTMGRGDTLNFRPRLSYEEKVRIRQTQEAVSEVAELTEGTVTQMNEQGLSWEDRTGLYVWKGKGKREEEAAAGTGGEE